MLLSPVITADSFHRRCTRQYIFLSQLWTYYKSLLTGISAKTTARKVFDFKKLKTIVKIFICYDCKYLPFANKLYHPEMNITKPYNVMLRVVAPLAPLSVSIKARKMFQELLYNFTSKVGNFLENSTRNWFYLNQS